MYEFKLFSIIKLVQNSNIMEKYHVTIWITFNTTNGHDWVTTILKLGHDHSLLFPIQCDYRLTAYPNGKLNIQIFIYYYISFKSSKIFSVHSEFGTMTTNFKQSRQNVQRLLNQYTS